MTAMTTAPFTAARVQGRYRVLDEAGQIVLTLNSKAKAEARAAELNAEHAEAALSAQIEADVAMEQAMDAECPQEDAADLADLQAEWDAHPEYAEAMTPATAEAEAEEPTTTVEEAIAQAEEEPKRGPSPEAVAKAVAQLQAELTAAAPAIGAILSAPLPGEERQEEPEEDAGTKDAPAPVEKPQKPAKAVKPKADQPAPHAFTTVGTKIKNHCTDCGRSWAAAAHRKFREAQGTAPEVAEGEWTPAADDTTPDGKAPAEGESSAS